MRASPPRRATTPELDDRCEHCHPDHRGRDVPLVRWPGGDRDGFDHAKLARFPLRGAHAPLECRDCHKPELLRGDVAPALSDDERPRTFLGLGTTCAACHDDPHEPSLGDDCKRCHDESDWGHASNDDHFDHGKTRFPLRGGHAEVGCAKCHGGTDDDIRTPKSRFATCAEGLPRRSPRGKMTVGKSACTDVP